MVFEKKKDVVKQEKKIIEDVKKYDDVKVEETKKSKVDDTNAIKSTIIG